APEARRRQVHGEIDGDARLPGPPLAAGDAEDEGPRARTLDIAVPDEGELRLRKGRGGEGRSPQIAQPPSKATTRQRTPFRTTSRCAPGAACRSARTPASPRRKASRRRSREAPPALRTARAGPPATPRGTDPPESPARVDPPPPPPSWSGAARPSRRSTPGGGPRRARTPWRLRGMGSRHGSTARARPARTGAAKQACIALQVARAALRQAALRQAAQGQAA